MKSKLIAKNNNINNANQRITTTTTTTVRKEDSFSNAFGDVLLFRNLRQITRIFSNQFSSNLIMIVHRSLDHHPMKILLFHLTKKIHPISITNHRKMSIQHEWNLRNPFLLLRFLSHRLLVLFHLYRNYSSSMDRLSHHLPLLPITRINHHSYLFNPNQAVEMMFIKYDH